MQSAGFAAAASIAAQAFVAELLPGDAIGVTSITATGNAVYPPGGGLATVDGTLSQIAAANAAIRQLSFTSADVSLGAGLQTAYGLLPGSAGVSAAALLIGTGNSTLGPDPLHLSSYAPTWACAPGPGANAAVLNQIAAISGGAYFYMPGPGDMGTVLNQIRGRRPGWATVLNQSTTVAPLYFWLQPVTLAGGLSQAQFSMIWEDATRSWTGSSNPAADQVSVTLVNPIGIVLQLTPAVQGGGFVVFDVAAPMPGQWYLQVMYPGSAMALPMTAGVFCLPGSAALPSLRLCAAAPVAGKRLSIRAEVDGAGEIVTAVAEVVVPRAVAQPSGEVPGAVGHVRKIVPIACNAGPIEVVLDEGAASGSYNCKLHARIGSSDFPDGIELTEFVSLHAPAG
jgi:hypothetical protein